MATVGITTTEAAPVATNVPRYIPFLMPENGTLNFVSYYHHNRSGSGSPRVAIYSGGTSDTDPTGATLVEDLGSPAALGGYPGWSTIASSTNPALLNGTRYWIALKSASTSNTVGSTASPGDFIASGSRLSSKAADVTAWEATVTDPVGGEVQGIYLAVYADYTASGGTTPEGGSTASVAVSTTGAGQKIASGGSSAGVATSATGAGQKQAQGGAGATVAAATTAGGTKTGAGGSTGSTGVAASGGGTKTAQGGSTSTVAVTATGGGEPVSDTPQGGSVASVAVSTSGGGLKIASGGSTAGVGVTAQGAGTKTASGGSVAAVAVSVTGGGTNPETVVVPLEVITVTLQFQRTTQMTLTHARDLEHMLRHSRDIPMTLEF